MNKKDCRFLSFAALAALTLLALPFLDRADSAQQNSGGEIQAEKPAPVSTCRAEMQELPSEPVIRYLIMEQNGAVAVYDPEKEEIIDELVFDPTGLPEKDREILRRGIPVYSDAQLASLLCDFTE